MVYRIRYRDGGVGGEAEAVLEANSPNEALVKFWHTRGGDRRAPRRDDVVTSVRADWSRDEMCW